MGWRHGRRYRLHRRRSGDCLWRRGRRRKQGLQRAGADVTLGGGRRGNLRSKQALYATDQLLRLKWLADQFVGFYGDGFIRDGLVYNSGHQNDGYRSIFRVLLDLGADGVAVLIGHDDVGDDGIGRILRELSQSGGGVGARDDVDALAAKGNLDD